MSATRATLFYDGGCGLCHRAVLFLLARDHDGSRFLFAPLGGETFRTAVPPGERATLPDTLVLLADDGRLLVRSDAVAESLRSLGGGWRAAAGLARLAPRRLRDAAYDTVARSRRRLFAAPRAACPVVPARLRSRFLP